MAPKKQIAKKIEDNEELEPYLSDKFEKLVIIDLYAPWTGPCDMMNEYYKTLGASYDNLMDRCAIIQVKNQRIPIFAQYRR